MKKGLRPSDILSKVFSAAPSLNYFPDEEGIATHLPLPELRKAPRLGLNYFPDEEGIATDSRFSSSSSSYHACLNYFPDEEGIATHTRSPARYRTGYHRSELLP